MVEKPAAPRVRQRPALRVDYSARLMLVGRNVPQFLDTEPENLRAAFVPKPEQFRQALRQAPARAFGEEGVARVQLHSGLVVGAVTAIAGNTHVAGGDSLHRAVLVEEDLGCREAGED